jgi:hypothetical protein
MGEINDRANFARKGYDDGEVGDDTMSEKISRSDFQREYDLKDCEISDNKFRKEYELRE